MLRLYRNMGITRKMIAIFLAICVVSIVLSSSIISYASLKSLDQKTAAFAQALNAQAASSMQSFIDTYQGLMMAVLVDSHVFSLLSRGEISMSERAEYQGEVNKLLFRLTRIQPRIIYAGIGLKNGLYFQTGATGETRNLSALMASKWMLDIEEGPPTFNIVPMHSGDYANRAGHGPVVSAVQKLYGPSRQYTGIVLMDIKADSIMSLGGEALFRENVEGIRVVVTDESRRLIYDSTSTQNRGDYDSDGFIRYDEPDDRFFVLTERLEEYGLYVHTIYPKATLKNLRKELIGIALLAIALCALFSFLCAFGFSRSFTRPIRELKWAINEAKNERYIPVKGQFNQDEFGELIDTYNRMVERIEYLIDQVYRTNLQKKDAQLVALQTQINPHMMFNTLETIRMKALIGGNRDVAEMVRLLGKMFRMTLENVNQQHTVKNELDYVNSFMILQNMRYRAEHVLQIDVAEELMDLPCIVILFQPLVENSLTHGLGKDGGMRIRISGRRGEAKGEVLFRIEDDGTGMEPDRLMALSDRLAEIRKGDISMDSHADDGRHHIGLENIAKRLYLQYGAGAFLKIARSNESGTVIDICILDPREDEQGTEDM